MKKLLAVIWIFGGLCASLFLMSCNGGADAQTAADSSSATGPADGTTIEEPAALIQPPLVGTSVGVNAGYAGNGVILDIPAGFTASQCRFTAALATMDGKALSAQASIDQNTGKVSCTKVVQEREEVPPEFKDCVVSFTILCTK